MMTVWLGKAIKWVLTYLWPFNEIHRLRERVKELEKRRRFVNRKNEEQEDRPLKIVSSQQRINQSFFEK